MVAPGPVEDLRDILVYRPGALGDLVAIIPFLMKLRKSYPTARIHLLCSNSWRFVGKSLADKTYSVEDTRLLPLFSGGHACHFPCPKNGFDIVYVFLQNRDPLFEQGMLQFAKVVRWIQTRPSPEKRESRPALKSERMNIRQFLHDQEFEGPMPTPEFRIQEWAASSTELGDGAELSEAVPEATRISVPASSLSIHPGSGSAAKNWPLESFAEVARFWRRSGGTVIWTLGPADEALKAALTAQRPGAERIAADSDLICADISIAQLCALYEQRVTWLCNDSGPAHLAAALGRDGIAIFGASDETLWAPQGLGRIQILGNRDAFPAVEEVKAALASLAKFD